MKEILYFYLSGNSQCSKADRIIRNVVERFPEFREVKIKKIEKDLQKDIACMFDFTTVPCFFVNGIKIFESNVSIEKVSEAFKLALISDKQTEN